MNWNDLTKVEDAATLVPSTDAITQRALLYLGGDYWQSGKGWAGTQVPLDAENRAAIEAELQRTFTPQPLIEDCIGRLVEALTAQEPSWEWVLARALKEDEEPSPAEVKPRDEVNAAQGEWWDARDLHEVVQEWTGLLLGAGRAPLRFWVPPGLLDGEPGNKRLNVQKWEAALESLFLEVPALESVVVATDRNTMREVSVFVYAAKDDTGKDTGDDTGKDVRRVEVSFLDGNGQTVVRILQEGKPEDETIVDEAIQNCGGELYVAEALMPVLLQNGKVQRGRSLVTDAVQRMQNALNVVNTMLLHNGNLAGFRERNYINLQLPKREVPDPTEEDPENTMWVDDTVEVGPSAANFLSGITYKDAEGNEHLATGTIIVSDPVDPKPLIEAKREFEQGILKAFKQLYVAMGSDATASGISRVVAMVEFVLLCRKIRPKIEGVLRSRLKGVAYLAAHLANDQQRLKELDTLRVRVDVRITPPPMSADEKRIVMELYQAGLIDRETALIMLQVEDTSSALQKLDEDPTTQLEIRKRCAEIVQTLAAAGAGIQEAAIVAGFDKAEAKLLAKGDFVEDKDDA